MAQTTSPGPDTAGCLADIDKLAQHYDLAAAAPQEPANPGPNAGARISNRDLQASSGVIMPPPAGDTNAIMPPTPQDNMPTAPAITPHTPQSNHGLTAAQQAQMEALLQSARADAQAGRADACRHQLDQARAIAQAGPG